MTGKGDNMKCPKCSYNSFEYLDSCKKCGTNLSAHKESFRIRPLLLHHEERRAMAGAPGQSFAATATAPTAERPAPEEHKPGAEDFDTFFGSLSADDVEEPTRK